MRPESNKTKEFVLQIYQLLYTKDMESVEGIVIHSFDYKEAQRIATLFSREKGLISLIIKGVHKKKLFHLTTPLCQAEFICSQGKSDLYLFCEGSIIDLHLNLRQSLSHLQVAGSLLQSIRLSQLPGKSSPLLYELLNSALKKLPEFTHPQTLKLCFYLKLLLHEGLFNPSELSLSSDEWNLISQLLTCKSYEELKRLEVSKDLEMKMTAFFKEQFR